MKFVDFYKVFGVAPSATVEEIKVAYRKLARRYHPDVNKFEGAEKRFMAITEANETLSDPAKRTAYDALRSGGWIDGQEMDAPPPNPGSFRQRPAQAEDSGLHDEILDSLFGASRPRGGFRRSAMRERGEDLHYPFAITLEESYRGAQRTFQIQGHDHDHGSRTITVTIAKGLVQGSIMRLRGQGQTGSDPEANGDLYLEIRWEPHAFLQVDGRDVTMELPITPWEAVLGAKIDVPTLGGSVTATIPAGAQPGQRLRLRGRGLPGDHPTDQPGDQYLALHITVPPTSSDTAKELYRKLAAESTFHPRDKLRV